MPIYRYRMGHNVTGVSAQVVGEALDQIAEEHGGRIVPGVVVAASKPRRAPLHNCFTWDDAEAAEKCREEEARRLIRSYVVVSVDAQGGETEEIANVSVARNYDHEGPAYMPVRNAMEDPELRARVVAMAKSQLDGWQARYDHLEELGHIFRAIDEARAAEAARADQEAAARRPRARGRRGRPGAPAPAP